MALNDDEKAELVAYLDGELDETATQAVEARIAADPEARAELEAMKQTWFMLDYLPKVEPSPNFTNQTMARLTLEDAPQPTAKTAPVAPRRSAWPARLGWAAAALVALGAGFGAMAYFRSTPDQIPDADMVLIRKLSIIENWRLYENADDMEFVRKLNDPDLFGSDPG